VLKQLFEFVQQILFLQRDIQKLKEGLAGMERELRETNEAVRRLAYELERINEREVHEREKLQLKLENALLRARQSLPPPGRSSPEEG
jgi:hypothetical protein